MARREKIYDIIIIGMGPAGLSAGIYTARANIKTLIIGKSADSKLYHIPPGKIENYFGLERCTGKKLLETGKKQAKKFAAKLLEKNIVEIKKTKAVKPAKSAAGQNGQKNKIFEVITEDKKKYSTKALIFAVGTLTTTEKISNEKKFLGKGVSYCALCDASFFRDKPIIVIGSDDSTAKEALELCAYTRDIQIYTNGEKIRFTNRLLKKLEEKKIKINGNKITKIAGDKFVEKIILQSGKIISVKGIFITQKSASFTSLTVSLKVKTKNNFIIVNRKQETNIKGVFAAGDCTGNPTQLAKAVGEGAVAGINATAFVQQR